MSIKGASFGKWGDFKNIITQKLNIEINKESRFQGIFEEDKNLHLLFWFLLGVFLVLIDRSESAIPIKIGKSMISLTFFSIVVYTNWFVLIPYLLKKRKCILYIVALIIWTMLLTPPKTFAFYFLYTSYPEIQAILLQNQNLFLFELFFVGAVSSAFKITQDWLSHERDKRELQRQQLQSELNFLKSQINPHFLFNTLNNLYALTLKKSDEAPEMVLRLSEMMRYMLYECNEPKVPLEKEINYLKNYLELEKLRQGEEFEIDLKIIGKADGMKIAPLIFMPFIENSFKHGMSNQLKDGFVNIDMEIKEEEVELKIENSIDSSIKSITGKKSGGIGLINIKRRLELIYPANHKLNILSSDDIYKVDLLLKLN